MVKHLNDSGAELNPSSDLWDAAAPPRFVVSRREGDIAEEQISIIRGEKTSESIPALTFCDTCDVGGALV